MSLYTEFDHYNLPLGPDGSPYDFLERLRDEAVETETPVGWSEVYGGFWVVAGWEENLETHTNTEAFSNVGSTFPSYGSPSGRPLMLAEMDAPLHKRYRKIVTASFSGKASELRAEQIRGIANDLIDTIIDLGRADVCTATDYLPERVTAAILGLPLEDAPNYRRWVHAMVLNATDPEAAAPELAEMGRYWAENVEARRGSDADDLLTSIVHAEADGQRLNDEELLDFFTVLLLGGLDNTARFLGNVFWRLAWDRNLRRWLADHPDMVSPAVDEFLRLHGPAMTFRTVRHRVELGGVTMEPGQTLGQVHPLSSRDPKQFEHPDVFIPTRTPNRTFALGRGVHQCLGIHLAKVETRIMIQEFLRRIPEFELDQSKPVRWQSGQVGAMIEVPIVFPAGGGRPETGWLARATESGVSA